MTALGRAVPGSVWCGLAFRRFLEPTSALAHELREGRAEKALVRSRTQRGFTLTELMIVVVIIAVLATLAVYGVRSYIRVSRTSEVTSVVQSIRGAQEAYREETFSYLNVSGNFTDVYPDGAPRGTDKFSWGDPAGSGARWAALGVQPSGPVMFGYTCVAGAPNTNPLNPPAAGKTFNWAGTSSAEPWYVVRAIGDQDGDGEHSVFVASSFTNELYIYQQIE